MHEQKKIVCITGGYGRLGQDFGRAFRDNGDDVVLTGRDPRKLKDAAAALECGSFELDVTNPEQTAALRRYLEERHGRLDVLINNAVLFGGGAVDEIEPDRFRDMMVTNIYGPFLTTRCLLPLLEESPNALVINVSSTSGHRADPGSSAYNASKFGLMGFSEALRKELRTRNIRVTTLSPSLIRFGDLPQGGKGAGLNGRDIAEAAVFLAKAPSRALFRDIEMWATNP